LAILLTIPHAGEKIPEELRDHIALTPAQILREADIGTCRLFRHLPDVQRTIECDTARCIVDVNRARTALPPEMHDGAIKTTTTMGDTVLHEVPRAGVLESVLQNVWDPFHGATRQALQDPGIHLHLDCHAMDPVSPPVTPAPRGKRPAFCLGNRHGTTAPNALLHALRDLLMEEFDLGLRDVACNHPFRGGYITQRSHEYGAFVIQVEINKALYVRNLESSLLDSQKMLRMRDGLSRVMERFNEMVIQYSARSA
jgi:N-formylglutamate amidohydrolase